MSSIDVNNVVIGIVGLLGGILLPLFGQRSSVQRLESIDSRQDHVTSHEVYVEGPVRVVCNVTCTCDQSTFPSASSMLSIGFVIGCIAGSVVIFLLVKIFFKGSAPKSDEIIQTGETGIIPGKGTVHYSALALQR